MGKLVRLMPRATCARDDVKRVLVEQMARIDEDGMTALVIATSALQRHWLEEELAGIPGLMLDVMVSGVVDDIYRCTAEAVLRAGEYDFAVVVAP